ncbi:MAG TPA: glycosyltransferase family 4 protein [Bryobacteraceae bacterium]|nr:glycosyltransferase family 4 protein [Bryobacteraceae bacterium]
MPELRRHLINAELLSWQAWIRHPARSMARLIPLRAKEAINQAAGRPIFDLSFYLQFQPNSLPAFHIAIDRIEYLPPPAGVKRVTLVTPHLGPGGAEAVLLEIASALCGSGFETLLIATHSRDDRWRQRWDAKVAHVYDLASAVPVEHRVAEVCSIAASWNCNFVLVQNSLFGYAALPPIRRLLPDAKLMDVVHNVDESWDIVAATASVAHCLDVRVAVSDLVRRRLLAAGTPEDRIHLISSGVELDRFRPAPVHSGPEQQILFAGRLDPVKRPLLLVDIAAELTALRKKRDFRFIIAGDGPEEEPLRNRIREAGLNDVFDLRGQVHDLAHLYAASDVVILPSRSEGVPLVILEALASARPLIASNVGGIPEALDASCGFLIDPAPDEAAAFARALTTLLDQPELRARMGAAGRRQIEANYDIRRSREAYASLFD